MFEVSQDFYRTPQKKQNEKHKNKKQKNGPHVLSIRVTSPQPFEKDTFRYSIYKIWDDRYTGYNTNELGQRLTFIGIY